MNRIDIDIFGDIVNSGAVLVRSDMSPDIFREAFAKGGDVRLNINSGGGDVLAGLAMVETIREARKAGRRVEAHVVGVAASMAGAVACACDEIVMGPQSYLMIHNPWALVEGDAEEMRHKADVLDSLKKTLIGLYETKFDLSREEISAVMDAETWLSGADVLNMKTHGITVDDELEAAACVTRRHFAKAPEGALKALIKEDNMKPDEEKTEEVEEVKEVEKTPEETEKTETTEKVEEVETPETPEKEEEAKAQEPEPLKTGDEQDEEKDKKDKEHPKQVGASPYEEESSGDESGSGDEDSSASPEYAKLVDTLMSVEAKRRDFQAKADKALADYKDLASKFEAFKADASTKIASLQGEKKELEKRLARIAASTFGNDSVSMEPPDNRTPCEILASIPPREREKFIRENRKLFD